GSGERPAELSKWMTPAASRKYSQPPRIEDIAEFGGRWRHWWNGMQPKWRRSSEVNTLPLPLSSATGKQDIGSLKKAGPNGFSLLLVSLKWW
ncbi:hypothetical protein BDN70DRAFT_767263, partial [Pholiota conissans]